MLTYPKPSPSWALPIPPENEKALTSAATEVYKLRKQVVEPVFGIIKEQQGGRRFLLRGLLNVAAEWTVLATAFNLRTLCRVWRSRIFDQVFGRSPCPSPWPPEPHHAW